MAYSWTPLPSQYLPSPALTLAFDTSAPLLFSSNSQGTITSYFCSPESSLGLGGKYTSFKAHWGIVGECKVDTGGVLSVGGGGGGTGGGGGGGGGTGKNGRGGSVRFTNRRGLPIWSVETEPASTLTTFAYTPARSSEIIATGPNSDMYVVNVNGGIVVRKQPSSVPILHLRKATQLVASTMTGSILLMDTRTPEFKVSESVLAHSGGISQIETEGNHIVTLGYTMRQGLPLPDPYLKVHDVRFLRPLSPIPFPTPPSMMKFHPRLQSTVIVTTVEGRVQILDIKKELSQSISFQVETNSYLTSMAIAPTGEGLAFGDADGYVHLWSAQSDAKFCRFESELELPDIVVPPERIDWREDTPLNRIGMPYYTKPLLSLLPPSMYKKPIISTSHLPIPIDPTILSTVKTVDFVGYAPYPASLRASTRRNQVPNFKNGLLRGKNGKGGGGGAGGGGGGGLEEEEPMFRSERDRKEFKNNYNKGRGRVVSIVDTNLMEETLEMDAKMPKWYRKVEIKYSRFGVEDFDFGFYNKTIYSGLETHITNSYTNSLLQAFNYLDPIRSLAKAHTFTNCIKENCLLCEAGFLFRMLNDAKGMNCQASNFSRAFCASPQVIALGLMDHDGESSNVAYASLIQTCNRFLLEQMTGESELGLDRTVSLLKVMPNDPNFNSKPPLAQLLRVEAKTVSTCTQCGATAFRDSVLNVIDLVYPRRAMSNEPAPASDYASILRNSIHRETIARMVCSTCRQTNHLRIRRILADIELPPILIINAGVRTADELEFWIDGRIGVGTRFLQPKFSIGKLGDAVVINNEEGADTSGGIVYELRAMVVQIQADGDLPHLVALARVSTEAKDPGASWHLFNDFLVKPISEEEALSFPGSWKIPAIMFYQRVDAKDLLDFTALPLSGDPAILCQDITVSRNRDPSMVKHQPFFPSELPRRGTLVSIDAEFVSLQQEEAEFHSDGTKNVIRPSRMTLARVSVLRGEGPETGIPFIDDHIHTSDTVVDYLTEYSGIRAGDLDPFISRHTLVPLKVAYKKLRLLVDLGCVFIGHGLNKDFRIINIYIPPNQIIDTVNIYHLAHRQRKLSLRFLAWAVLHSAIQTDTHDSIEDARTALQLYEHYNQLEAEGRWEDVLEDIYRDGKQSNFKVPAAPTAIPSRIEADSPGIYTPPRLFTPPHQSNIRRNY